MNKRQKISLLLIFCVLISTILVGCSSNSNFLNVAEPSINNTLVWNLSTSDVTSWDPHTSSSGVVGDISRQIFEELTVLGEEGVELGTAESYTVSPNDEGVENTVYIFKIRQMLSGQMVRM